MKPPAPCCANTKSCKCNCSWPAVAGAEVSNDDTQRFQQIGALLFAGENTSRFLLLEMRLQQTMADVFKTLSDAAGLDMPGM